MKKKKEIKRKRSIPRKILNGFIGLFGVAVFLFILFLGFSQTETFHKMLREKLISYYDENFNGQLNIGDIRGSLFTSLEFDDVRITEKNRTFIAGQRFLVKLNPLLIFRRTLRINKIEIDNWKINFAEFEKGKWNYQFLFRNSETDTTLAPDSSTTKSEFPFEIVVDDFEIKDLAFSIRDYEHLNSDSVYKTMNYGDVRIKGINLSATVFVNLSEPKVNLILNNFEAHPNLSRFDLKHFSGFFYIDSTRALADNVEIETDSSSVSFSAEMKEINFFKPFDYVSFKTHPVKIKLQADPFCFDDLSSFLESTEILKGKPVVTLEGEGQYGSLDVKKIKLKLGSTEFNAYGKVNNLERPEKLWLDVNFENSTVNESDARRLLPTTEIPDFNELTLKNVKGKFRGYPTNFYAKISAQTEEQGKLDVSGKLNLDLPRMKYDFKLATLNLDIRKIIGTPTLLNLTGKIKGKGVDPADLNAVFNFNAKESKFNGYTIDTLGFSATAKNKVINLDLLTTVNKALAEVRGSLDFTDDKAPVYNLTGVIDSLDLARFGMAKSINSNLNFSFIAQGQSLDIDEMNAKFIVGLRNSVLKGQAIKPSKLTLAIVKSDTARQIKLKSDFLDLNLDGNFLLSRAIKLLDYQSSAIAMMFRKKFSRINPAAVLRGEGNILHDVPYDTVAASNLVFNYSFAVKDFEPIAIFLNAEEFDVYGEGSGKVKNDSLNFSIDGNFSLKNFFNTDKRSLYYFSDINADLHFSRNNLSNEFNSLFGSLTFDGRKIFVGEEIKNISADLVFNQSKLVFDAGAKIGKNLRFESEGELEMSPEKQKFTFSYLDLNYKGDDWENDSTIAITVSPDSFSVSNLIFSNGKAVVKFGGAAVKNKGQNFALLVSNFPSFLAAKYFANSDDPNIKGNINLSGKIFGNSQSPLAEVKLNIDSVGYFRSYFGNLISHFNFANNELQTNVKFKEFESAGKKTLLTIQGGIPLNLFEEAEIVKRKKEMNLKIHSGGFQIASLSTLIPYVKSLKGLLNVDAEISGSVSNPDLNGNISLSDCSFRSRLNNLDYNLAAEIKLDGKKVLVKNISLHNAGNSEYRGGINGSGEFELVDLMPEKLNLKFKGSLQALSKKSRSVSPNFYGNLFVKSEGDILLKNEGKKLRLAGAVNVTDADLTIVPPSSGNSSVQGNIIYDILADTSKINYGEKKYREYLSLLKRKKEKESQTSVPFDYDIKVDFNKIAKMQIVLSKVWNQNLVVLMKGGLDYQSVDGKTRTQGALELQPGSKLEFIKTFAATGKVKFETDPANPYLDIITSYVGNYNVGTDLKPNYIDVEVEMKLKGTLDKLGENLMKDPNSISIYKGAENIKNKIRDTHYDVSDAILFIYTGRFKEDLTAQDKSRLAGIGNTATSFLGSTISGILNSVVGDVVSDIKIDEHGEDTRITISGRYQNIRYTLSGTTKIQNINEANIKIEYGLLPNLILRLERKDPVVRTFGLEEKISELGLKYKVEF